MAGRSLAQSGQQFACRRLHVQYERQIAPHLGEARQPPMARQGTLREHVAVEFEQDRRNRQIERLDQTRMQRAKPADAPATGPEFGTLPRMQCGMRTVPRFERLAEQAF